MSDSAPLPRYLWRRGFAFLIDYALASVLVTLLLLPFLNPDRNPLRLTGFVSSSICTPLEAPSTELTALIAPNKLDEAILCRWTANFVPNGSTVELRYDTTRRQQGIMNYTSFKSVTTAINGDGAPIRAVLPQNLLVLLVLLIFSGALVARGRKTPGKWLLSLRVTGSGCGLCRELRRLGPLLLIAAISFALRAGVFSLLAPTLAYGVTIIAGVGLVLSAGLFIYYVWPLMRWRGAMPYDRATGFAVTRG